MFVAVVENTVKPGQARAIINRSSFGSPTIFKVHQQLLATAVANGAGNTFGAAKIVQKLAQSAIVDANAFGFENFKGYLGATCIDDSADTFGSHAIHLKNVLTAAALVNASSFGSHKLVARVAGAFIDDGGSNAFGSNAIRIPNQLVATGFANASTFGASKAVARINQSAIVNANGFGSDSIGTAQTLRATGWSNVSGLGGDKLVARLAQTGFSNANSFGAHTIGFPNGGAGLLETAFTVPPKAAGWTHRDGSSFSGGGAQSVLYDITIAGTPGLRLTHNSDTGAAKYFRAVTKPLSGVGQWSVTARLRRHLPAYGSGSASAFGIMLYESSSGKCASFGWTANGLGIFSQSALAATYQVLTGTGLAQGPATPNVTNFVGGTSADYDDCDGWFRITRDSAGRYNFAVSQDGDFWSTIKANYAPTTAGFAAEADEIGIGFCSDYSIGAETLTLDCFSYAGTGVAGSTAQVVQAVAFSSINAAFTLPSTPTAGNWLIVFWVAFPDNSAAAGWAIAHHVGGGISSPDMDILYRQVQNGDGTSFTPEATSGISGRGVVFEVSGLPSTWSGIEQHEYDSTTTGGTTNSIAGHACSAGNTVVLAFGRNDGLTGTDTFTDSGWTQDATLSGGHGAIAGHKLLVNSGDSPPTLKVATTGSFVVSTLAELYLNSA